MEDSGGPPGGGAAAAAAAGTVEAHGQGGTVGRWERWRGAACLGHWSGSPVVAPVDAYQRVPLQVSY